MLSGRLSPDTRNKAMKALRQPGKESNQAWIRRAEKKLTPGDAKVLLLGGTNVADFRIRVAQSHARIDLQPSFWSHVGILIPGRTRDSKLWHVPLDIGTDLANLPKRNAICVSGLEWCSDRQRFQNIALLEFPSAETKALAGTATRLRMARLSHDFVSPLLEWLGFVWGAGTYGNPLLGGVPLPSASFVESAFASANIDLAPGMADRTLCPEAIWQAATWWKGFYAGDDKDVAPRGLFTIGQKAASVVE